VVFSGILMALALIMMKDIFDRQNFITGYVFSRFGIFLSALALMLSGQFRGIIKKHFSGKSKKDNQKNFGLVLGTKIISGSGTLLINYSISIGSVALINALVSIQYLFTFLLATLVSIFLKNSIQEKLTWQNLLFKFVGIVFIVGGIFLIR
jgi:drug/metabolite transporter (DMT)-like permease